MCLCINLGLLHIVYYFIVFFLLFFFSSFTFRVKWSTHLISIENFLMVPTTGFNMFSRFPFQFFLSCCHFSVSFILFICWLSSGRALNMTHDYKLLLYVLAQQSSYPSKRYILYRWIRWMEPILTFKVTQRD